VTRDVDASPVGCDRIAVTSSSLLGSATVTRGLWLGSLMSLSSLSSVGIVLGVSSSLGVKLPGRDGSGSKPAAINSSYSVRSRSSLIRANTLSSAMA
jgi:hypothetical protein